MNSSMQEIPLRRGIVMLLAVMAIAGCAYKLVHDGSVNPMRAEQVETGLERVRQLAFIRPVPLLVENRAAAQREMAAKLAQDESNTEFRLEAQAGDWLGLYPSGINLQGATLALLRNQVAGFYDPDSGRMILVEGAVDEGLWNVAAHFFRRRDAMDELLLAHELTHALQDQHFDLKDKLNRIKDDDDQALALKSVAEGDATIAGFGYVAGGMNQVDLNALSARLSGLSSVFAREAGATPEALRAPMAFEYSAGVRFVAQAYARGGWTAVDDLYRHPPQSSQQILHPSLYFDRPQPPRAIEIEGYEAELEAGWHRAQENTLGEFMLSVLLKRTFGAQASQFSLAEAWAGDRLLMLTRGGQASLIWLISFRDEPSAARFATAYAGALDRRLMLTVAHGVDYQGSSVLVMIGPASANLGRLAPRIFAHSRIVDRAAAPRPAWPGLPVQAESASPPLSFSRPLAIRSRSLR
jgi:hypothetical protein